MGRVVGIDLGTTNSVVAFWDGHEAKVIPNREGSVLTPSVVGYSRGGQVVVGQVAWRQRVVRAESTIANVKRIIGLSFEEAQRQVLGAPYTIVPGPAGEALVQVGDTLHQPAEVSAHVLDSLRESASAFLGEPVRDAVITVPAYFNDAQRQATREAGRLAGLEVRRIINEPTAAALFYGLEQQSDKRLAIYDLGGGTFDVSVLQSGDGLLEVLATAGDTQLGGQDIDQRLVTWLLDELERAQGFRLEPDRAGLQRLCEAAEQAKIDLSQRQEVDINLPFVALVAGEPRHLQTVLTRSTLDGLIADLVGRTLTCCQRALDDAAKRPGTTRTGRLGRALGATGIDEVVLVGGSSRIPQVQEAVRRFFGKEPRRTVNPDEVVALGAAVQGAILSGELKGITLSDVTPFSLGLERADGTTSVLVPRNSAVPTRVSRSFSTMEDNQTAVEIHVVQGEAVQAHANRTLGRFALENIAGGEAGDPEIEVTFSIDIDGIVHVKARDRITGSFHEANLAGARPEKGQPAAAAAPAPAASAAPGAGAASMGAPAAAGPSVAALAAMVDGALRGGSKVLETYGNELAIGMRDELEGAFDKLQADWARRRSPAELTQAIKRLNDTAVKAVKSLVSRGR